MESYDFEKICKNAIIKYCEENGEITDNIHLTIKNVYKDFDKEVKNI